MMRCHQLVTVVACMLPRASRGVRLAGMSVTPGWSARMGGMRHLTMNEAAAEEMAVEDVPTDITAPLKSEFLQEMQWRGFIHQATNIEGLDEALVSRSVTAYLGFDATASSLHVGSLLQIMLLRHYQRCGHKPVVLVGGGTTKVGDPSGKDASRVLMTQEKIDENIAGISQVFEKFITFGDGPTDALMVNNDDWLSGIEYLSFLREYGRYFTINRMLSFESVKQRLARESPLSFLEFNYMILQAYDFLELHRRHKAELQFGGSDQWGNIINGVELVRHRPPSLTAPHPHPHPCPSPGASVGARTSHGSSPTESTTATRTFYRIGTGNTTLAMLTTLTAPTTLTMPTYSTHYGSTLTMAPRSPWLCSSRQRGDAHLRALPGGHQGHGAAELRRAHHPRQRGHGRHGG